MNNAAKKSVPPALPESIAGRYQVHELLGRGGMADVYRVSDGDGGGQEVALKQLQVADMSGRKRAIVEALFEHEFHRLAQLHHPRMIEVYDYGVGEAGPFYTMELLTGSDLVGCSPLPWREACRLAHDVCSSLALLHSRRLVHRDVSPRNVRCGTDGRAKLIDFGAMVQMGPCTQTIGTPAFAAPELANRMSLDGRSDLFSLGATLYYALTGRRPFAARTFADLAEAWTTKPIPPSAIDGEIPPALDGLVASLLALEPALRPRSAFEVMERLAAIADLEADDAGVLAQAFLSEPTLIGRAGLVDRIGYRIQRAHVARGRSFLIEGAAGSGRSRVLDACLLEAKTHGAIALRAGAQPTALPAFELMRMLVAQLLEALPKEVPDDARAEGLDALVLDAPDEWPAPPSEAARAEREEALVRFFVRVARHHTLVIAIDDLERADAESGTCLAMLAARSRTQRLLCVFTTLTRPELGEAGERIVSVVGERATSIALPLLDAPQIRQMFDAVFGDVPHVALIADRIHDASRGNPKHAMALAQSLLARGIIAYREGSWTLPSELAADALPRSPEDALAQSVIGLTALARRLAQCHALCQHRALSREDHHTLAGADACPEAVRAALLELIERGVISGEGDAYALARREFVPIICQGMEPEHERELHAALAALSAAPGVPEPRAAYHELRAGRPAAALEHLTRWMVTEPASAEVHATGLPPAWLADLHEELLPVARELGQPRAVARLLAGLCLLGPAAADRYYLDAAPEWLAILKRDSGLSDWETLADVSDPAERLTRALTAAVERFGNTPEQERCYAPDEAIKQLAIYVVTSIAIGGRTLNKDLLASLPELLEPFVALSPMIDAMWNNAIATRDCTADCRFEQARERWLEVFARLEGAAGADLRHAEAIRLALAFVIGTVELSYGRDNVEYWAQMLDRDAMQSVNAMYLRKVARLQAGDLEGAEHYRREAELRALHSPVRQMFTSTLFTELLAHAMARDLTGVRQVYDRIAELAEHTPGWIPYRGLAEGVMQMLRGDADAGLESFARVLSAACDAQGRVEDVGPWYTTAGPYIEALAEVGRLEEARAFGLAALATCRERGIAGTPVMVCALARAEAALGDHVSAIARLDELIAKQQADDVVGLHLGVSYETRAYCAILAGDRDAVERYGRLTAEAYRHGRGSPLGARYERLMREARSAGLRVLPPLSEFEHSVVGSTLAGPRAAASTIVDTAMRKAVTGSERARCALELVCELTGALGGQLYLVHEGALSWAAAFGDSSPDETLIDCATQGLERVCAAEREEDEGPTQVVMVKNPVSMPPPSSWTDVEGIAHEALVVSAMDGDALRHVAVAVVRGSGQRKRRAHLPDRVATLRAVAEYLLAAGDV